jgi:phospholipid/cholesterol/gamma-HCH transport system substrate-binding protein
VEGRARVTLALSSNVTLHEGAQATILDVSLMGQKAVDVYPGDPRKPLLPPDQILPGTYQGGITDLLSGVGGTLATFERLANRFDSLLVSFDGDRQQQVGRTFDHLERATGDLASLLSENREELSTSIKAMSSAMTELQTMMNGRGESFGNAMDQAATTAARLDSTLTTLDRTVSRVDGILARVEGGEGTLGHLVQEDALYEELVRTLRDAKELLVDVRENPKRYFKFSVF